MTQLTLHTTITDIIASRPSLTRVLDELGLDYCCSGPQTLEQACRRKSLDADRILAMLHAAANDAPAAEVDVTDLSLAALADHIERTHHAPLKLELPRLEGLMFKVAGAHGGGDARLLQAYAVFHGFAHELLEHLQKEERVLFPMIRELEAADGAPSFHCGPLANPIGRMLAEHDNADAAMRELRSLTDGFKAPGHACNTYRALLDGLARLEQDLERHTRKEAEHLFPRTIELERRRMEPAAGTCGCGGRGGCR
ncbi:MAG: DUF542 domain-containing protein [Gammaproteobacteria bacterium]|nr:DUF542 domain-containing protein [Gammaproteobacteria bacterium]